MKECTVAICLDAFRFEYLNEKDTPFLFQLASAGSYVKLKVLLAFTGLLPAIFSSVYPEDSNVWTVFQYDPDNSPFLWMDPHLSKVFSIIENFPIIKRFLRFGVSGVTIYNRYMRGETFLEKVHKIPFKYTKFFSMSMGKHVCERNAIKGIPTLFDSLRKHNVSFHFLDWPIECMDGKTYGIFRAYPYSDRRIFGRLETSMMMKRRDFYYTHVWELDGVTHRYGPNSKEGRETLKNLDYSIEKLVNTARKRYDHVNFVAFSDHGMVQIKKTLDVTGKLDECGLVEGKDYLPFFDSTMARFWFKNKKAKIKVMETLQQLKDGLVLSNEDLERFHINFKHTKYGELVFLANPGVLISPNYFNGSSLVRGMHGYDPACPEQDGIFILNISKKTSTPFNHSGYLSDDMNIIDIYPTILDVLGLPKPSTCKGKSIRVKSQIKSP